VISRTGYVFVKVKTATNGCTNTALASMELGNR